MQPNELDAQTDFGNAAALAISKSSTPNDRAYIGEFSTTSQAIAQARGNSTVMASGISGGTAFDGNWHSIAFRRNGTAFELFVDGTRVASTTATLATGSTCNRTTLMHPLLNETTGYAKGSIQHAAIWNTSLSDSEIAAIQTARNPSATPAKSDFNGDDKADILWQNTSTGQRVIWLMNGTTLTSAVNLGFVATSWSIAGSSDFNGDGKPDIVWQNTISGQRLIWIMNGTTIAYAVNLPPEPTYWSIAGTGDFNGDGKSDILWQNNSTGQRVIWLMNGTTLQSSVNLGTVPTSWSIRNY